MNTSKNAKHIMLATLGAVLAAALVLFAFVLPAEYGYDPLGTGAMLGLNALSGEDSSALHYTENQDTDSVQAPLQLDQITFELSPFESVEYKYRLAEGETLLFSWQASAQLLFDLHAEPDGAAPGFAQTFDKSRDTQKAGRYVAPFNGIHGWFWQNRTERTVTLTLKASGFLIESKEMRDGQTNTYTIQNSERKISSD